MTAAGPAAGHATAAELAAGAVAGVMTDLARLDGRGQRGIVVDSPPGAGKSTLVVRAAAEIAAAGEQVMVVAQTNSQVDDLVDRLATAAPGMAVGRLSAQAHQPAPQVTRHAAVTVAQQVGGLAGCPVVIGTAAKWATVSDGSWPWAIIDEAYQMRSDMLIRIAGRFQRALFVGDPGQLDPFSTIDIDRWAGLTWDPMQSAVAVLLRNNPDISTDFLAGTGPAERRLEFATSALGTGPVDEAVQTAAASGWALYELPARQTVRTDREAVAACAALAERFLQRGAVAYSERAPGGAPVTVGRIAIGTAHRDQARAIRAALNPWLDGITVDTANRLQGREYDVVIVLHPLSGRRDATAFHLEAGRLCVLTSRHRHACIVVARAGIPELLDAHPSTEPVHLNVPAKFPDGWEANQAVMAHLERLRVRAL
jgi:hypothetical protein